MRIRTSDGRECDITQAQWDLVYSGDGSTVITAEAAPEATASDGDGDGGSDDETASAKTRTRRS